MRTKEIAIQKTEDVFRKMTENFYLAWEQKVKGTKFTIMGYFVLGEIVLLQVFDDGSIYHYLGTRSVRWDFTEDAILNHFQDVVGNKNSPVS